MKKCILCKKELDHRTKGIFCKECMLSNSELNPNWKGGLSHCQICGKELSKSGTQKKCKYCVECYIKINREKNHWHWMGGKPHCIDCGKEIWYGKKRCRKCWHKFNQGENNSNFKDNNRCFDCGKKISHSSRKRKVTRCWDCYCKWAKILEHNPNFVNGKSREPYPIEFNNKLRESIRKRDNYECQNCGMTEEEHLIVIGTVLLIHHIDYNKQNCKENNLITLCKQCNIRANFNRFYWQEFYQNKMNQIVN